MTKQPVVNLILDSGAYSAWKQGKPIDVKEYCDYILANQDMFSHIVALDIINPKDPEAAAAASFENLKYMHKRGIRAVPVFHAQESIDWLHRMLDLGCDYIGLSASSVVQRNQCDDWYSMAWSELVDSAGKPLVKAHAFGESRIQSLSAFPWYSADTASWTIGADVTGRADFYNTNGKKTHVSFRHDKLHSKSAPDHSSLDALEVEALNKLIAETGMTLDHFSDTGEGQACSAMARMWTTARLYVETERRVTALCPISHKAKGFFLGNGKSSSRSALKIPDLRLHLAINTNYRSYPPLLRTGHKNLLVSYFYSRMMNNFDMRAFVYDPEREVMRSQSTSRYYDLFAKHIPKIGN